MNKVYAAIIFPETWPVSSAKLILLFKHARCSFNKFAT